MSKFTREQYRGRGYGSACLTYSVGLALVIGASLAAGGCAASPACRKGVVDDVTVAARTTGEAVKTGAETGVAGVKAAGRAAGGYVAGGSDEASEKWKEGKADTKETAHAGSAQTKREADVPMCKD